MIAKALAVMYPGITFGALEDNVDCVLFENLGITTIVQWNRTEPKPTLEEISAAMLPAKRAQVIEQINAERNRREQTSFTYLGKQIDSDAISVQRITVANATAQMALSAGVPYEVQWACADNSLLTLDAVGMLGMMQALGSYGLALHMHGRALKAQVLASDDPESIDILTGWPE